VLDNYPAEFVKLYHGETSDLDGLAVGVGHDPHPLDRAILPRPKWNSLVNIAHIAK
jgi:hypothetical protein